MPDLIEDAYNTLWHYTTASGLEGILKSQQLWATNIKYLNDDEEFQGFFNHRFDKLHEDGTDEGIKKINGSPRYNE